MNPHLSPVSGIAPFAPRRGRERAKRFSRGMRRGEEGMEETFPYPSAPGIPRTLAALVCAPFVTRKGQLKNRTNKRKTKKEMELGEDE